MQLRGSSVEPNYYDSFYDTFFLEDEPEVATNMLFDRANHHIFADLTTSLEVKLHNLGWKVFSRIL